MESNDFSGNNQNGQNDAETPKTADRQPHGAQPKL